MGSRYRKVEEVDYRREIPDSPYKSLIVKFADVLRRKWGDRLVSIVLYGSMARGDFHGLSDIDLLIVAEGLPPTFFARLYSFSCEIEVRIEPPKWYDVGEIIEAEISRFPDWFKERVGNVIDVSRDLRSKREPGFYGDEMSGRTPAELFERADAEVTLRDAQIILDLCKRLISSGGRGKWRGTQRMS